MNTTLRVSTVLLFIGLSQLSCNRGTDSGQQSCPIKISEGGLILLNVHVSDSIDGRFILDTGSGIHVISNSLSRRIAAVPRGQFTGFRHTGERIDLDMFQIQALSIAGLRQERPIVATWSVLDSFKIDGILSLKFFEHHPFTLDLQDSVLVFETPTSLSERAKTSQPTSIKLADVREQSLDVFASFQISDTLRLECIIDTGSPATVIDARYMNSLGIDSTSRTVQKTVRKSLFGASETEYITTIPRISIWDAPGSAVKNLRTIFKHRLIYDGLVGMDFFIGKILTFDIPNRRLFIGPDKQ